jgi:hypothetical protein
MREGSERAGPDGGVDACMLPITTPDTTGLGGQGKLPGPRSVDLSAPTESAAYWLPSFSACSSRTLRESSGFNAAARI